VTFVVGSAKLGSAGFQSLAETIGIKILHASKEVTVGTMPVDERTIQASGVLHGGATIALAESVSLIADVMPLLVQHRECV